MQALVRDGLADGERLGIRGGSAGGWTALAALTTPRRVRRVFGGVRTTGSPSCGAFAADTHDFESRYLDGLVGPLPEDRDVYVERAPLRHVDRAVLPGAAAAGPRGPGRAAVAGRAVRGRAGREGHPVRVPAFAGESHGFRKAETVIAALEAELSFYGEIFGFTPPGVPPIELT